METLEFVQAKESDKSYLLDLRKCTMIEHLRNVGLELTDEEHETRINDVYECLHIIFYVDEKVGALKYRESENWLEVVQLQIHPDYQGKGIGNKVMRKMLNVAGVKPVRLSVLKSNPAKKLYDRLGFVVTGEDEYEYHMQAGC
jgi:ribosomal protein S18 acetylase RimI-like enzyme